MLVDRSAIGNAVMRGVLVLALCLSPIALPSAIEDKVDSCSEGAVSRLYFGQTTPVGALTELQWRAFVAESVTLRFPAGFTELQAQGHWRDGPVQLSRKARASSRSSMTASRSAANVFAKLLPTTNIASLSSRS